jgi:hypothetical protein
MLVTPTSLEPALLEHYGFGLDLDGYQQALLVFKVLAVSLVQPVQQE